MTKIKSKMTRPSAIIKALQKMGFKEHQIEHFGDKKEHIKGYQKDWRNQQVNIRIKGSGWGNDQNYVGGCSNDIGFEKLSDGSYAFHVSDYDVSQYGKNWQDKFMTLYGKSVVEEVCQEQNFFISDEHTEGDEIVMRLESPW